MTDFFAKLRNGWQQRTSARRALGELGWLDAPLAAGIRPDFCPNLRLRRVLPDAAAAVSAMRRRSKSSPRRQWGMKQMECALEP